MMSLCIGVQVKISTCFACVMTELIEHAFNVFGQQYMSYVAKWMHNQLDQALYHGNIVSLRLG